MLVVKCSITVQFVVANQVKLATHSGAVNLYQKNNQKTKHHVIHAYQRHAARTLNVAQLVKHHHANAFQVILVLRQIAAQSV